MANFQLNRKREEIAWGKADPMKDRGNRDHYWAIYKLNVKKVDCPCTPLQMYVWEADGSPKFSGGTVVDNSGNGHHEEAHMLLAITRHRAAVAVIEGKLNQCVSDYKFSLIDSIVKNRIQWLDKKKPMDGMGLHLGITFSGIYAYDDRVSTQSKYAKFASEVQELDSYLKKLQDSFSTNK